MAGLKSLICMLAGLVATATVYAQQDDKNGVTPNTISRPSGPGSLEGLGDAFQPALNTGMAKYTVSFALPDGVAGFTPQLSLRYDSGRGFGVAGIGWSFGPACIRRQTEKGLPRYGQAPDGENIPDRFLGMEGEELVPLQNGYYLAKVEGLYLRYRQVGDHWEAHTKSGIRLEFGLTPEARVSDPSGKKIYSWCLQRQTDTHGNVIEYQYIRPDPQACQVYLSEIRYGPGPGPWAHFYSVRMTYEDRPDPFRDYRSGFKVCTSKRLALLDVLYDTSLVRRYALKYEAHTHWSLLTRITQYGDNGSSMLPATTFGYSVFNLGPPASPISAAGSVIGSSGEPPAVVDNSNVEFIDLDADGLPDILTTDTGHFAYINRGQRDIGGGQQAILWEGPIQMAAEQGWTYNYELSAANVHLADMTGDGISDLVVTDPFIVQYFENSGALGWAAGRFMSVENKPPPAPFGANAQSITTSDLSFNKRIDIIQSEVGAYHTWFNQDKGRYTGPITTPAVQYGAQFVEFGDAGVDLADMNGDRLNDVVKITPFSVVYWPSTGYGRFDHAVEMPLPDRYLDESPGGNLHRAKLVDVNGDGLSDLVVERARGTELWFWQNMGNGTLEPSRVVIDIPVTSEAKAHWTDINGNGTTDLIYADSSLPSSKINTVDLGELLGGAAYYNVLTSIDNGYGRRTQISYRSSTEYYIEAFSAGHPWSTSIPFPTSVVSRTETTVGLNLDGFLDEGPDGDIYRTDYVYRDGYYDPLEKQFRGFAFVKHIQHGDELGGNRAPTLVTRYGFHTGAPDGLDNDGDDEIDEPGDLWIGREEEPLKGVELWRETTVLPDDPVLDGSFADDTLVYERIQAITRDTPTASSWQVRDLATADGGLLAATLNDAGYRTADSYLRDVRQAVRTEVQRTLIERLPDRAKHKTIITSTDVDPLGNVIFEWNYGDVDNPDDDIYTRYEYAIDQSAWMVDRISRTFQTDGGRLGQFVSETRNYYDGQAFQGLSLGQLGTRGLLHRTEALVSDGTAPPLTERSFALGDPRDPTGRVDVLRQKFDQYGNPITLRDANYTGDGHERRLAYEDHLHKFPVSETIVVGGGSADLQVTATFDPRLGVPLSIRDMNGQVSNFSYDTFGRLKQVFGPDDPQDAPTSTYIYDLGAPISSITTVAHDNITNAPDVVTTQFFDGLGRKLGALGALQTGRPVMSGVTLYNTRGQPWKVFQPYFGGDGNWSTPSDTVPASTTRHDALGRVLETITPVDEEGVRARITREYSPLTVTEYDGEDNTLGLHRDTPKTLVTDGLGRLIEVQEIETISQVDHDIFVTKYRYALPDLLAEIEDAAANIKYMRYDGLGRKIFMNDPDRGHMTYAYDALGNLLSTVDAKGQEIQYTFDGANRLLTKDYLDCCPSCQAGVDCCVSPADEDVPSSCTPLSVQRTPDVAFHYDEIQDRCAALTNLKGKLAWVEDLTGKQFHGYDDRGLLETVVKRVDQIDGPAQEWTTTTRNDNLGRVCEILYPDGTSVQQEYDARGLLSAIPGYLESATYRASGQKDTYTYANGVTTTHTYDPRLRLSRLLTQPRSPSPVLHQDLSYDYDQANNIVQIADGRFSGVDPNPRNQTASFEMDDHYRLRRASGTGYGTIDYDYDRLGNMALKTSADIPDPDVDLGTMLSGGSAGTSGRIGRNPGDSPGPHAITATDLENDGQPERTFEYDDNGNMTDNNGDQYVFDFADRLGRVIKADDLALDIRYLYDYTGRRVIKRIDRVQTTYINKLSEIRDGQLIKYVFAGSGRIARVRGELDPAALQTQRIPLNTGWNLISFQIDPGSTDPAVVLAGISAPYAQVLAQDPTPGTTGTDYLRYVPGAQDNTLAVLAPNQGFWIEMLEPGVLIIEGLVSEQDVVVSAGTPMLVGLPGLLPRRMSELRMQYPDIKAIWAYESDELGWRICDLDTPDYLNTLTETSPGRGYSLEVNLPTTIIYDPTTPSEAFFYHGDHLGSTNTMTDASGGLVSESYNYPFGMLRHEHTSGVDPFDPYYQFTGKEQDAESRLHYFEARYYASDLGVFAGVDALFEIVSTAEVLSDLLRDPMSLNSYAYGRRNPLNYIDPTGYQSHPRWILTIYVDQPGSGGDRDTYEDFFDPDPGHTFVELRDTQTGESIVRGFHPSQSVNPFGTITALGDVREDSKYLPDVDVKTDFPLTEEQYKKAKAFIEETEKNPGVYNLNTNNCTDFGICVAREAGQYLPDTQGKWPGGGKGSNPGDLGEDLRIINEHNRAVEEATPRVFPGQSVPVPYD